jgi:hypothetical protein
MIIPGPDPDDDLDSGYTDAQGHFHLSGDTTELTTIDAFLKIYHDCNDGITVSAISLFDNKLLSSHANVDGNSNCLIITLRADVCRPKRSISALGISRRNYLTKSTIAFIDLIILNSTICIVVKLNIQIDH